MSCSFDDIPISGNINGGDTPIPGVETRTDEERTQCVIDPQIFEIPPGYRRIGE